MKHTRSIMSIGMATIMLLSLCAVCASTSVVAATSSNKASVQASSSLVGAPIANATPSACVLKGTDSMYVFVRGFDGALWYTIHNLTIGGFKTWQSLGGQLTSSPAAVSREAGIMNVFVRGTNGAVYDRSFFGGAWSTNWVNLGGQVAPGSGPGVSGWPGREDVFVAGTNGALYQNTWTGTWSGWTSLGGKLTSSPAAVSRSSGLIDVYVRGTNGAVYERGYDGEFWYAWYNVGGQVAPGTGPAVCSYGGNREDVFVEGTNGALYHNMLVEGWSGWTSLGGQLTSSPTAATSTWQGTIDIQVFVRGTNGFIYYDEYSGGSWSGWLGPIHYPP